MIDERDPALNPGPISERTSRAGVFARYGRRIPREPAMRTDAPGAPSIHTERHVSAVDAVTVERAALWAGLMYDTGEMTPVMDWPNASLEVTWNVLVPTTRGTLMLYLPEASAVVVLEASAVVVVLATWFVIAA